MDIKVSVTQESGSDLVKLKITEKYASDVGFVSTSVDLDPDQLNQLIKVLESHKSKI